MKTSPITLKGFFRKPHSDKSPSSDAHGGFPRQPWTVLDVLEPPTPGTHA